MPERGERAVGPGQFCVTGVQRPTVAIADRFRPRHRYRRRQLATTFAESAPIGADQPAK
jgi:hypothetical protein